MKSRSDGTFRGWLKDTIGKLELKHRAIPEALAALPGVPATLNQDGKLTIEDYLHRCPDQQEGRRRFPTVDSDKDGVLSEEEFVTRGGQAP